MTRLPPLNSPLLLGFDEIEQLLSRAKKGGGDGYPPYNIERLEGNEESGERMRITLAVAGFKAEQLTIMLENNQLAIQGRQNENGTKEGNEGEYLHRGIASRQFSRTFVLADGIKVIDADLKNGLLCINLHRPQSHHKVQHIQIRDRR